MLKRNFRQIDANSECHQINITFLWYINVVRVPKTNETLVNRIISFINLLQRTNGFDANSSRRPLKAKQQPLFLYRKKKPNPFG